jgi:hypothetical protein
VVHPPVRPDTPPPFAHVPGVGADSHIPLLVAGLDLQLVRLLRGAIRTADIASGRGQPVSGLGPAPTPPPVLHVHPDAVYEPRRHIHPEPRVEPRRVIHPPPRVEPCPPILACSAPCEPFEIKPAPVAHPSRIQPPWRVLPWQTPVPPRPVLKVVIRRPDIVRRGQLLDVFI